jgi:hypothetical protein
MKLQWNAEPQSDTAGRSRKLYQVTVKNFPFDICALPGYYVTNVSGQPAPS